MRIQFPGTIEYVVDGTPYTLCAELGWLLMLPEITGEQDLHEADGWMAADGFFQPLGGASGTVRFTTDETCDSIEEAQAIHAEPEVIDGVSLFQATGILRITLLDDTVIEYDPAVLTDVEPDLPDDDNEPRVTRAYTFQTPAAPSVA